MTMSDDFLDQLGEEFRAGYNPPPETPRHEIWVALQARRSVRAAYNPPPATPRERIWTAIEGRRARRVAGAPAAGAPSVRPWPARRWVGWALPIAATLLVGISIGRLVPSAEPGTPAGETSLGAPETSAPDEPAARRDARDEVPPGSPLVPPLAAAGAPGANGSDAGASPGEAARAGSPPAGTDAPTGLDDDAPPAPAGGADRRLAGAGADRDAHVPAPGAGTLYRVAALETLGGAEALLGSVGEGDAAHARDGAIADWGEDMLSQTRLLMDSPAADDPAMRVLLEDLELVLAQLVRLGEGTTTAGDLELIEGAVREQQLLYRIRALLPAGRVTAGT